MTPPAELRQKLLVGLDRDVRVLQTDVASAENVAADGFDSEARRPPGGPAPDWSRAGGSRSQSESHFQCGRRELRVSQRVGPPDDVLDGSGRAVRARHVERAARRQDRDEKFSGDSHVDARLGFPFEVSLEVDPSRQGLDGLAPVAR